MPDLRRKLQVFISSTYTDLEEDRQAAVSAILSAGHIPAGMELFTSGNKSQWETIKRWIDDSDIFMLILGGRYGSIEPESGLSYIELEYRYAIEKKKPFFALVIESAALDARSKVHGFQGIVELENRPKYDAFRKEVDNHIRRPFSDAKDIHIETIRSIASLDHENSLAGWVRGERVTDTAVLINEMRRLARENERLKHDLEVLHTSSLNFAAKSVDADLLTCAASLATTAAAVTSSSGQTNDAYIVVLKSLYPVLEKHFSSSGIVTVVNLLSAFYVVAPTFAADYHSYGEINVNGGSFTHCFPEWHLQELVEKKVANNAIVTFTLTGRGKAMVRLIRKLAAT